MEQTFDIKDQMDLSEQMRYKYLMSMDGNGPSAGRTEKYFTGNSVVFKTDSEAIEFYYSALKPFQHFVPVKPDLSDLDQQLLWAIEHDAEAKMITDYLQIFARSLHFDAVACYFEAVFTEYASLLNYKLEPSVEKLGPFVQPTRLNPDREAMFNRTYHLNCPAPGDTMPKTEDFMNWIGLS